MAVRVGVAVGVRVTVGVALRVGVGEAVGVDVTVTPGVGLAVVEGVGEGAAYAWPGSMPAARARPIPSPARRFMALTAAGPRR
ncbi:hypothetical protein GCM10028815_30780 [Mariniluteicoccus flavus]